MGASIGSKLLRFVDRLSLPMIGVGAILGTLLPAIVYWMLSNSGYDSYIGSGGVRATGLGDAVYFSIVTEATLGYGDISPVGYARLIACCQVIFGLVLAGVAISKITSMHGKNLRMASKMATGDWIEIFNHPENGPMVSFCSIRQAENELVYDGENFDKDGQPLGFFKSILVSAYATNLTFEYSNQDSNVALFGKGITSHLFVEDPSGKHWIRHHATCRDHVKNTIMQFEGYRATTAQIAIIRGNNPQLRRNLIKEYIALLTSS